MPLEHAKAGTPGFGRNIETEMKAGKPQKQAVAIAYKMAGERKDAAKADCIYEKNGEFFFEVPGFKDHRGPFATMAEAKEAAAKAGVVMDADPCWEGYEMVGMKTKGGKPVPNCVPDADEAILGRMDADRIPAHIRHHGVMIDTSFKKGSNGTEADYWVVEGSSGRFYSLAAAKEVAENVAKRRKSVKADARYTRKEEIENAESALRYYEEELKKHERRAKSKDRDEAEDGKASVRWAKESIAREKRNLANAKARKDSAAADYVEEEAIMANERKDAAPTIVREGDQWIVGVEHDGSMSVFRLNCSDYTRAEALEYASSVPQYTYGKFTERMDSLPPLQRALHMADALYHKAHADAERDLPGAGTNEGGYGDADWITNDPVMAKELKRIDREYEKARSNAQNLPLEKNVKAYREAKETRDKAYDAIRAKMAK